MRAFASNASAPRKPAAEPPAAAPVQARLLRTLTIGAAVLAADLYSKQACWGMEPVDLAPFLSISPHPNDGGVFGLFIGRAWANAAFIAVSVAALAFLGWIWRQAPEPSPAAFPAAVGLVFGGALGNLWDRIVHGSVRDFLDVHAGGWHWPTFNVADSAICVGTALLAWIFWRLPAAARDRA